MDLYIREWPDDTVLLVANDGRVIWNFISIEEAQQAALELSAADQPRPGLTTRHPLPQRLRRIA
jgi:hypothetical protein